ncbi:MAG TPA: PepSY domain-containing protein [Thauera sp.]|nr:PepSY domain-containing protein [Thauera sp.]HHW62512.1 PepSY domain-containing protein [Rhodocyclaceae bacterium]
MRATTLIATLALTGGLIGAGATVAPASAQSPAPAATSAAPAAQSNWMSIKDLLNKLEAAGYRDFREVERDDNRYEVKAVDPQGQRVELDVDPVTGDILKTEVKRSK